MKPIIIAFLLLATTLLRVQPVVAGQGSPDAAVSLRITLSATRGNPGDRLTISGSGAVPGRTVFVSLAPQAGSAVGAFITEEGSPAADGTFSVGLTIPANVPDGVYAVRAEQFSPTGAVLQYYWNAFTVGAGARGPLLPASGVVRNEASDRGFVTLAWVVLVLMLSRGMCAATKRLFL